MVIAMTKRNLALAVALAALGAAWTAPAAAQESAADAERAKVVARVLAEVDYGQNRLYDAQRMVDEALAAKSGAASGSSDSSGASGGRMRTRMSVGRASARK